MNYTDEEVELITEWHDLRKAFIAAKQSKTEEPEHYAEAREAMSECRAHWRRVREYVKALELDEVAEGDAVASPEAVKVVAPVLNPGGITEGTDS